MIVTGGATDVSVFFSMKLAASGADATGLTISDFDMQYTRIGETSTAKVDAVALAAANTAHTDNRGIEVDPTDQPGLYRFDWPDAAFTAGVREVGLTIKHASCFTEHRSIEINPFGAPAGASLAADIAAIKTQTAAIEVDTAEIGAAGAGLTNINLPNQTMDIVGNITGNLSGSVGSVTGAVGSVTGNVGGSVASVVGAVGSVTGLTASNLDATISSRASAAGLSSLASDITTILGYIDTEIAAILADTNELQTDWVSGGRLDLLVDAIKAVTDALSVPTANANADALLDRANAIETGLTLRNALRLLAAFAAGDVTGGQTGTEIFKSAVSGTKDRITSANDATGTRTVTADLT